MNPRYVCGASAWCLAGKLVVAALLHAVAAQAAGPVVGVPVDSQTSLEEAPAVADCDSEIRLDSAASQIPRDARALVLVDSRLYAWIRRDLTAYVTAAAARRKFAIGVLPIAGLDDCPPSEIRRAIQHWHTTRPKLEGILFVGNVKLPSFLIALLNGCAVGGFQQPGSKAHVDVQTAPERNMLVSLVYGRSAFLAALGSPHNRVDDEQATPLLEHLYANGYLGMAHLLRLRQQDNKSPNPGVLRGRQEMLIGDPFLDADP